MRVLGVFSLIICGILSDIYDFVTSFAAHVLSKNIEKIL